MNNNPFKNMDVRWREVMQRMYGDSVLHGFDLFRSLAKSYHMIANLAERDLSVHGLSSAKLRILLILKLRQEEDPGQGMLPSELSKVHGVTPNTISSLINSLREARLIEQDNHPKDRRKHIIRLTVQGQQVLDQLGPEHFKFTRDIFDGLSVEEQQILTTLLQKLVASVVVKCQQMEGDATDR
jgi:MarR family transcriptional regulator, 2-MHQ and catechol-resistance regulon repressor